MEKAKYDVFISYSRKDLELVKGIKKEIDRLVGIDCWMDLDGIESGEQFEDVIISAIDRSDTLLFMMSRASMTSEWALDEIDFAKRKGKRIILIAIERVEMTDKFYFRYHKYDNIDWNNLPQREKLIRDLRKWFNKNHSVCQHDEQTLNTTITDIQTDTAEVHIEVDADCDLYIFKKKITTLRANEDNIIHLKPGTYKMDFVSCKYSDIKKSLTYQLGFGIFSDVKEISLKEAFNQRNQAEVAKRRAEEEAKRKSEEVLKPKTKEDKRKENEEKCRQAEKEDLLKAMESIVLEPISQNGMWGYKNNETEEIVLPCIWNRIPGRFYDGLAFVRGKNGLFGYIDKTGELVIPHKWKNAESFSYGLAAVMDDNNNWGFINIKGEITIPCKWSEVGHFVENIARVKEGGLYGYINTSGKVVIPCNWIDASDFREGMARIQDRHNLYGFINQLGEVVIPCKWKNSIDFNEGLAAVMDDNDKWGYINKDGESVIPCKWDNAGYFNCNKAKVYGSKGFFSIAKWHTIDKTGNIIDTI